MGRSSEGVGLPPGAQMGLLVVEVGPDLGAAVLDVLPRSLETAGLAHFECESKTVETDVRKAEGRDRKRKTTTLRAADGGAEENDGGLRLQRFVSPCRIFGSNFSLIRLLQTRTDDSPPFTRRIWLRSNLGYWSGIAGESTADQGVT